MRQDGELHAEDDRKRKEELETRNEADNAVYRTGKMVKDNADKISADDKARLEPAADGVKEALKGTDASAIKTASEKLNETWQAVSKELYKAAAEKTRPGKGPAGGQPGKPPEADNNHDDHKHYEEPVSGCTATIAA